MKWFKHYSTLSEKDFSQRLIAKHGLAAYARYLILLETCSSMLGDRPDGKYVVSRSQLSRKLFAKQSQLTSHIHAISLEMDLKYVATDFEFIFEIPILSELRHKDALSWKQRRAGMPEGGGHVAGRLPRLELEKEKEKEYTRKPQAIVRESDFDALYQKYPKKKGKILGKKRFFSRIKTKFDLDQIHLALDRYVAELKKSTTDKQYIKEFGTWMGVWEECLDEDYGRAMSFKKNESFQKGFASEI